MTFAELLSMLQMAQAMPIIQQATGENRAMPEDWQRKNYQMTPQEQQQYMPVNPPRISESDLIDMLTRRNYIMNPQEQNYYIPPGQSIIPESQFYEMQYFPRRTIIPNEELYKSGMRRL